MASEAPDPILLADGTVTVFTENSDAPGTYDSQQVGPGDDDYAYWVAQAQAAAKTSPAPRRRRRGRMASIAAGVLIAIVVLLWIGGTFDRLLYPIGLNMHECARNGFGAAFCGKELDEYRERQTKAKEEAQQAGEEAERKVKQSEQETEATIKHSEEEAARQYTPPSEAEGSP